jgi:hypothetical protein
VTRLVGVEVRRLLARRAVRAVALVLLAGLVIGGIVLFANSHRATPQEVQAAEQHRRGLVEACTAGQGPPDEAIPPGMTRQQFCEEIAAETTDPTSKEFFLTDFANAAQSFTGLFVVALTALGASLVGAEWHAGTMTTLLTWEPRRLRVVLTKLGVAFGLGFVGYLALQAVLFLVGLPAAAWRGSTAGLTSHWWSTTIALLLRGAVLAGMGASVGAAVANLARNTAAAIAAAFAYFAVLEPLLRAWKPHLDRWLFSTNAVAFVSGSKDIFFFQPRSMTASGLVLSGYVVVLSAAAVAGFLRRDVAG